jgi:hypothetical protein
MPAGFDKLQKRLGALECARRSADQAAASQAHYDRLLAEFNTLSPEDRAYAPWTEETYPRICAWLAERDREKDPGRSAACAEAARLPLSEITDKQVILDRLNVFAAVARARHRRAQGGEA